MKHRLFCFGDSFVDWHIPKHHWTYYLAKHYNVHKFGKLGADNYSILYQLGNLPNYENGDRIVIVFTNPGRLPRRFYGNRREEFLNEPYTSPNFYEDTKFAKKLDELRFDENVRWISGERKDEMEFLKKLKLWLSHYQPIFITWSEDFYLPTSDFVTHFKVSSNFQEGIGESIDFHPGPLGCYDIYTLLHTLLKINDIIVEYEPNIVEQKLL